MNVIEAKKYVNKLTEQVVFVEFIAKDYIEEEKISVVFRTLGTRDIWLLPLEEFKTKFTATK